MKIKNWYSTGKPWVIAGPCSAETEEQLIQTVDGLVESGITTIRAGVWKPRTRPNSFEGVGEMAFPWIKKAKELYPHLQFAIEVASAEHVDLALKNDIDILWVGARTTVNPFNIQEIAEAVRGVDDIPVLVKNPINPDLALWVGALERFDAVGIQKLGAIHRGFSTYQESIYRNIPLWQIPIELKSRYPEILLINDPSHIAGKRDLLFEIAQKAMDLQYDGLIIESHRNPDEAWSDAAQQLTPLALKEMLNQLKIREKSFPNKDFRNELEGIRDQIDETDKELLEVLSRRLELVKKVGQYKKEKNVAIFQLERWNKILENRPLWGEKLFLDAQFVKSVYQSIHDESIRIQTEIYNEE
ncbi:bifunctional 3-deoxy-7-phosphoheptulonate synthase/chorismate mutase type II [Marivirga harenae]|uniref:bifunctional 3-deoxy-7-phosphoheptulonate synthase/chorismate mutase type II n=1 Tax=Marivirga harenae TaxID=2010992 RepID=UPI0026DF6640|nr:bifunctional 3-deoxy-7-phosphoheptulonate synthase/chorismate mutase type II [Marivirga harenae]WKV12382.1 bifunctional 3-deoxy-7-phosphoheptulonate synthase/chorismate mutase type II [Marivirga harenae]